MGVRKAEGNEQARRIRKFVNPKGKEGQGDGTWQREDSWTRLWQTAQQKGQTPEPSLGRHRQGHTTVSKKASESTAPAPPRFLNQGPADQDLNVKSGCRTEKNKAH